MFKSLDLFRVFIGTVRNSSFALMFQVNVVHNGRLDEVCNGNNFNMMM